MALNANTLGHRFNIDDPNILINNNAVHGVTLSKLAAVFTSIPNSVDYLPVRDLSYMIDYSLFGSGPFGFHLSNVLYYAAVCVALYRMLRLILARWSRGDADIVAFIATLIFVVHPLHVEVAASIAQRKDLLCALFFFLSVSTFIKYKELGGSRLYVVSLLLFALSFLSKQAAVMLPALVVLLNHAYAVPGERFNARTIAESSGFVILGGAITALALWIGYTVGMTAAVSGGYIGRIPIAAMAVFYYFKLFLIPYPLSVWHEVAWRPGLLGPYAAAAYAGIAAVAAAAWALRRKRPEISFFILWVLLNLIPVIGLVHAENIVAERYAFIPSAGYAALLGLLFSRLLEAKRTLKAATLVALAALILTYGAISFERNRDWRTTNGLLTADYEKSPDSPRLVSMLGRSYFYGGEYQQAFKLFARLEELVPGSLDRQFFTALLLQREGKPEEVLEVFETTPLGRSDSIDAHYLRGWALDSLGRRNEAIEQYNLALKSKGMMAVFFKRDVYTALGRLQQPRP